MGRKISDCNYVLVAHRTAIRAYANPPVKGLFSFREYEISRKSPALRDMFLFIAEVVFTSELTTALYA